MKHIIGIFFFILFSINLSFSQKVDTCNCNKNKKNNNWEAAHLTAIPLYSPLFILKSNNPTDTSNGFSHNNFRLGVRLYYYAPNRKSSFGLDITYLNRSYRFLKNLQPNFSTQEIELNPFYEFKTGNYSKVNHFTINLGASYNYSIHKNVKYGINNQEIVDYRTNLLATHKTYFTLGIGYIKDLVISSQNRSGQFHFNILFHQPFILKSFFSNNNSTNPSLNAISKKSISDSYFSVVIGNSFALSANNSKFTNNISSSERFVGKPFNYDEPSNKKFGSFYYGIMYNWKIDSSKFTPTINTTGLYTVRPQYNFVLGYHYSFASTYSTKNERNKNSSLFIGAFVAHRWVNQQSGIPSYFRYVSVGLDCGGKIGIKPGWYLHGGVSSNYYIIQQKYANGEVPQKINAIKLPDLQVFFGFNYRNTITFNIQNYPFVQCIDNLRKETYKSLEYRVLIGF